MMQKNLTEESAYTKRLISLSENQFKRIFQVQLPYKIRIRKIISGGTLDIGCGIGRILKWLPKNSIGVDHNADSVQYCRDNGLDAWTAQDFEVLFDSTEKFDNLLFAHVLEHLKNEEQTILVKNYLKFLAPKGKVVIITPQIRGYKSDSTHLTFTDDVRIERILQDNGLEVISNKSFPLPKIFGRYFKYNEFQIIAQYISE
jgi:2-polyprenyl-3-methyl-5-hydroxy-6-metoxy-1,4-benzoquinol methylase